MVSMVAGVLMVGVSLGAPPGAAADPVSPAARCEDLAGGLQIAPWLQPIVVDVCRRSPTFRRQVARLADVDGLTVTVHRLMLPSPSTALWRVGGLVRSADVQVPSGDARMMAELLAHEFEHILEQLDGVDLKRWVGRSGVRRVGADREGSPIETERAQQVGRLVAGQYAAAAAELTAFKVR
jgi:hypothetical protein